MTLTEISYNSRKYAPLAVLFLLVILIFFYAFKLLFIALQGNQSQMVYTNTIFGKIRPPFVKESTSSAGMTFTLDTVEGQPVTASPAAKVYFLPPSATHFGYNEKVYLIAKAFGFNTDLIKYRMVDTDAVFTNSKQKLSVDITNFNFTYTYDFGLDPTVFNNIQIPSADIIQNKATDFLKNVGRYPDELAQGKTNISYLVLNPTDRSVTVTDRPQDANAVEVDFYRPDIDGFPMVSPGFPSSQNYVIMAMYDTDIKVLRSQIQFFEKSNAQVGVYPLKTGALAWKELQEGKGYVISNPKNDTGIDVKNMFTAYLDPSIYQDYLEPVYMFLGDNNFAAYVPAVSASYLEP